MIRIIDRYVGKQVIIGTLFGVLVLTIVLVLGNIWKRLLDLMVEQDLPLSVAGQFVMYLLPFSFPFTIPWGFLTAVLLTFGRLSADNELVSLRMAGMSLFRICVPVFVLALGLSGACLFVNVNVAPKSEAAIKQIFIDRVLADPLALLQAGKVTNELDGYVMYIGEREGNELRDFQMVMLDERSGPSRYVSAEHVILDWNKKEKAIDLNLFKAFVANRHQDDAKDPNKVQMGIQTGMSEPMISLASLYEKADDRNVRTMSNSEISDALADGIEDEGDESSHRTELHRRISFSLACFTFALIGIPLGVSAQRRETSIGFALSLLIALVYFMFIILADMFKDDPGAYPHLLMWLPNVLFIGLGVWLFRRVSRR
ncbi:MAG: lipopolysaccharide export LptBFGC system permease protein LptF [Verrucomicrobiales bacterium]|jgi:lipopolysaccharide export LptBFGC system permease protein LptF